jgi:hypothetical protein
LKSSGQDQVQQAVENPHTDIEIRVIVVLDEATFPVLNWVHPNSRHGSQARDAGVVNATYKLEYRLDHNYTSRSVGPKTAQDEHIAAEQRQLDLVFFGVFSYMQHLLRSQANATTSVNI